MLLMSEESVNKRILDIRQSLTVAHPAIPVVACLFIIAGRKGDASRASIQSDSPGAALNRSGVRYRGRLSAVPP